MKNEPFEPSNYRVFMKFLRCSKLVILVW